MHHSQLNFTLNKRGQWSGAMLKVSVNLHVPPSQVSSALPKKKKSCSTFSFRSYFINSRAAPAKSYFVLKVSLCSPNLPQIKNPPTFATQLEKVFHTLLIEFQTDVIILEENWEDFIKATKLFILNLTAPL